MMEWTDRHCRFFHRLLTRRARLYTEMLTTGAVIHGDRARLLGFTSSDVAVMMRNTPNGAFERVPLIAGKDPGQFEGMLFHLEKQTEYYVESNGVRSEKFSLAVVDLPTVQPYGVVVPKDYDASWPWRLDVVLHGSTRPVGMSELKFIARFDEGDDDNAVPPDQPFLEAFPFLADPSPGR